MKRLLILVLSVLLAMTFVSTALADVYSDAGFVKKIPMKAKYTAAVENHGTVEHIVYTCHSYALEASNEGKEIMVEKEMYVYLPYGYSADQQYNVLYLMHGGGEDEKYWLTEERMGEGTLALLDNINFKGDCEPTIIVTPTTNIGTILGEKDEELKTRADGTNWFWKELREDIIPLIESKYSTFANGDVSTDNLIATREHRGFAGFSMGSKTTFVVTMNDLDMLAYFGNYSGSLTKAEDYVDALQKFSDYPVKFWFNGNGSDDTAHDEHQKMFQTVLELMPDYFVDGENCCWLEYKGGTHSYSCWLPELYNCLLIFFK